MPDPAYLNTLLRSVGMDGPPMNLAGLGQVIEADRKRQVPASGEALPLITFAEAEAVGQDLHDHWQAMAGEAPIRRDDLAWGDIVQLVVRKARDAAWERLNG